MMRKFNKKSKRSFVKLRPCKFCLDTSLVINYNESTVLRNFITERGKIIPSRISGNCARHQRRLKTAIKRARNLAILPYTNLYEI